jgi:excinuclease UvrABC ATPase subunit
MLPPISGVIVIKGAGGHNLKRFTIQIQDDTLVAIMGMSWWATSTLGRPILMGKPGHSKLARYGRNSR